MESRKKFRAWDKALKEMLYPTWEEDFVGFVKIGFFVFRSKKQPTQRSPLSWILRHPESFDLEQFIDREDINGKDIYEGSIVSFLEDKAAKPFIGVIKYEPMKSAYWIDNPETRSAFYLWDANRESTIEIVGNSHENLDLLKGDSS